MNNPVSVKAIKKISKSKGLDFSLDRAHNVYVMRDGITGECLMTYAPITVSLINNDKVWREECNKLKAQSYR